MNFEHLKKLTDMMFVPVGSGGILQRYDSVDAKLLNPLVQAYIGDAFFHLYVRSRLLSYEQAKVQVLNLFSGQIVSAVWQARAYKLIEDVLTDEEKGVFRRGRNAHSHAPRKASTIEYHASTGFEAVLGFLYLSERFDRLIEVTERAFQAIAKEIMSKRQGKG